MQNHHDDTHLVTRLQQRDPRALETVVRRYTGYVMTIIRKIGVPPLAEEDVEELTADVFIALWNKCDTVRKPSALKPFLAQIARNAAMDRLRKQKETLPLEEDILIEHGHSPETVVTIREQTQIINAALEAMDPTRRACMIYRYFYTEELAVIAKRLSLPLSTVKSHVYRGRQQLINTLKEWGYIYEEVNDSSSVV